MPLARPQPTGVSMTAGPHAELIVQHPIPAAWERIEEDQDPLPQELIGRDLLQCTSSGKLVVAGPSWDPMQIASPGFLVQQYYTSLGPLPDASWCAQDLVANSARPACLHVIHSSLQLPQTFVLHWRCPSMAP